MFMASLNARWLYYGCQLKREVKLWAVQFMYMIACMYIHDDVL